MEFKQLLLSWQVILLVFFIIGSIWAISPKPDSKGILVSSIGEGAFYDKLDPGTIIYSANLVGQSSREINNLADLLGFQGSKGYLYLSTDKGSKTIFLDGNETFNLSVESLRTSNLKFGLDIEGGIRALLEPQINESENETVSVSEIISILETRVNVYGLRQAEFRDISVGDEKLVMVQIAGGTKEEIFELLSKEGKFEAKIPLRIDNGAHFVLGQFLYGENKEYEVQIIGNDSFEINGQSHILEETFYLEEVKFYAKNITGKSVVLEVLVFNSEDILEVGVPAQSNYLGPSGTGGYSFRFGVVLSPEGAKRFAETTQNLGKVVSPSGGGSYLSEKIYFYLDGKETDALSISGDLRGKEVTNPVITGGGTTEEEAFKNRDSLMAVLKSGNLPVEVKVVSLDQLNATLGGSYLYLILLAGISAIIIVASFMFIRYKSAWISLGVMMTMLSEVILILGFAALTNWNLSTLALAGIVAAIGFGVDDQILIIDETSKKKERYTLKEGLKRAFFMIFGAGATTIAAMVPILIVGFGAYKEIGGFALTTIIGVLVGILITRPAFSKYVEFILSKE